MKTLRKIRIRVLLMQTLFQSVVLALLGYNLVLYPMPIIVSCIWFLLWEIAIQKFDEIDSE